MDVSESYVMIGSSDDNQSTALPVEDGPPETNFKKNDIIIVLIGQTGTGKSTFANRLVGYEATKASHRLQSCTETITTLRYSDPAGDLVLVDTPGMNASNFTEMETLDIITRWLSATYKNSVMPSGILYFHQITDMRMTNAATRNIGIVKALVGEGAMENVIIVSTMWEMIKEQEAAQREAILKSEYWDGMISKGARAVRHDNTTDSAVRIVSMLRGVRNHRALLVQREMVNQGKQLPDTTVGRKVVKLWQTLLKMADEVISGLEKRKTVNGWTEEQFKEVAKQKKIKDDVKELEARWLRPSSTIRQLFSFGTSGLSTIPESAPAQLPAQLDGSTNSTYQRLTSTLSPSVASSRASQRSISSSVESPLTPMYGIPVPSVSNHAITCLEAAATYEHSPARTIELSLYIIRKLEALWPAERPFECPMLHVAWFSLSVANHSASLAQDEKLGKPTLGGSAEQIELLVNNLEEYLNEVISLLPDEKQKNATKSSKRRISDVISKGRLTILCSNLAAYTYEDSYKLPIFLTDDCVLRVHHVITETLIPVNCDEPQNDTSSKLKKHSKSSKSKRSMSQEAVQDIKVIIAGGNHTYYIPKDKSPNAGRRKFSYPRKASRKSSLSTSNIRNESGTSLETYACDSVTHGTH